MSTRLLPALLKFWRDRRGFSQLELSLEAGVSARHLSFVESARSKPSKELLLRLLTALSVPLRAQNEVLQAAGFQPHFAEPPANCLPPEIEAAIRQMLARHEPWPMTVLALDGRVLRSNRAAELLFAAFIAESSQLPEPLDLFSLVFDPALMRPFIVGWESFARGMLSRLHHQALGTPDPRLDAVLERVHGYPGVPRSWRLPDFSEQPQPTLTLELARGELRLRFLIAVTVFLGPQQVTLEELRLESCFPLDDETRATCSRLAAAEPAASPHC
jgi:transcriptional regulator with XRE-family HTH domain